MLWHLQPNPAKPTAVANGDAQRVISTMMLTPGFQAELIAANHSTEEIRRFVEADSLSYLSLGGLREAVADHQNDYCYACYTGNYPTELVNLEELMASRDRRS